ncbi:UDPGT domain-containing protein [Cephalotus follicularis]|uniref:UDPGT domain-containing protein n=1 Tax=Cephalotus follicularis TaxID=3775 RepID=A0A1Q3CQS0_CEPFO|nr:UDPGT domain-containing protein [Cephalotus follicularis]
MAELKKLHIAMFPWLAFGHIIPFLELAKLIAQKGHKISFISTPRNIQRLPKTPPNIASLIHLVSLPLPHEANLPKDTEATSDLRIDEVPFLKKAFDGLQESVAQFLETYTPDWIIYDFAPHWLPPIAAKHGISRAFFSIFNAALLSFFESLLTISLTELEDLIVPPKWATFPTKVGLRLYETKQLINYSYTPNESGFADSFRLMETISGAEMIAIRSCIEIESDWLRFLTPLFHKPVVPVGLMPPKVSQDHQDDTWQEIAEWLDTHEKGSVVYIALGSEVTPSQDDFSELANGLELSGLPFFWALRKKQDSVKLPDGFEERVKGRGVVWAGWAPQVKVLSHECIGCFLNHGGSSSIIEGIYFARVLVMLPFLADQGFNARIFGEKNVGIEIPRNEQDGSFTSNTVAESLRLVMVNEEGRIYREKAKEMSLVVGDGVLQSLYIEKFLENLINHRGVST